MGSSPSFTESHIVLLVFLSFVTVLLGSSVDEKIKYPAARRDDSVVDNYHGTTVRDPYRWLESGDSTETKDFIRRQNQLTERYLSTFPDRERIGERLEQLWNFPRYYQEPSKEGTRYYFSKNSGFQNQPVIYVQDTLESEPQVFFDPNKLSQADRLILRDYYFSRDGKIFAYCVAENGEDWKSCHFMETETKKMLPDKLEGLKFSSLEWTHDNLGFFYSSFAKNLATHEHRIDVQQGRYHRMGTKQADDIPILSYPNEPIRFIELLVTHDGKYLVALISADFKANMVYLASLDRGVHPAMLWMPVVSNITDAKYTYVANEGSIFYFRTNRKAPKFQVIQLETDRLKNPRFVWTKAVVPEHANNTLFIARAVANTKIFLIYIEDLKHKLEVRNLKDGSLVSEIPLELGSVWSASANVRYEKELFFLFESFTIPSRTYRCSFDDNTTECRILQETKVSNLDTSNLETNLVFYHSKDQTRIPMFIVHKKGVDRNGTSPVLLEGYGGFNVNTQPGFFIQNLIFVKYFDGIYAIPGLRGGGDYGESWHEAGSLLNKHNVFQDFQSAAEFLVAEKYTQPAKIVITGTSNGGLLVGACVNRRPDLYGAAIPKVGVMDMVRYSKLGVGFWWAQEYGSPEVQEHFRNLYSYSPLHNIQKYLKETLQYPAMLILTGDHDDRVVPAHSFKYTAELQYRIGTLPQQMNPLLLKVETNVGHGLGKTPDKEVEEYTDIFAFISKALNVEFSYNSSPQNQLDWPLLSVLLSVYLGHYKLLWP